MRHLALFLGFMVALLMTTSIVAGAPDDFVAYCLDPDEINYQVGQAECLDILTEPLHKDPNDLNGIYPVQLSTGIYQLQTLAQIQAARVSRAPSATFSNHNTYSRTRVFVCADGGALLPAPTQEHGEQVVRDMPSGHATLMFNYLINNGVNPYHVIHKSGGWVYLVDEDYAYPDARMTCLFRNALQNANSSL